MDQIKEFFFSKINSINFIIAILVIALIIVTYNFIKPNLLSKPTPISPNANFPKADYSSDRSWIGCRDHQLVCLDGGLWNELTNKQIFELCGHEEICDDIYGAKK